MKLKIVTFHGFISHLWAYFVRSRRRRARATWIGGATVRCGWPRGAAMRGMAGCRACGRVCRKEIPWACGHHFNFILFVVSSFVKRSHENNSAASIKLLHELKQNKTTSLVKLSYANGPKKLNYCYIYIVHTPLNNKFF